MVNSKKWEIILFLILSILLSIFYVLSSAEDTMYSELDRAIMRVYNISTEEYNEDYAKTVTQLAIGENTEIGKIDSLQGIEKFTNLTALSITNNNIDDISLLSNLFSVKEIYLDNNKINDISALSFMSSLQIVSLNNNQITDISPLSNCVKLTHIFAENNHISSVGDYSKLLELESIIVSGNMIQDSDELATISATRLDVSYNQLTDIAPIVDSNSLKYMTVDCNYIESEYGSPPCVKVNDIYIEGLDVQGENSKKDLRIGEAPPKP